jgi:E3 ubiquitin-protein ligase HERC2
MKVSKEHKYKNLRVKDSSRKAWNANFVGEGSQDAGGPFRDSLSSITDELNSCCLPLLIPTQNHKNDHGQGRDLWTINPSSTAPSHLEMYKFLGALIGMAFRAGHVLDFKFPSLFWKQFIGELVTIDDLSYSDAYAVQAIKDVEKVQSEVNIKLLILL